VQERSWLSGVVRHDGTNCDSQNTRPDPGDHGSPSRTSERLFGSLIHIRRGLRDARMESRTCWDSHLWKSCWRLEYFPLPWWRFSGSSELRSEGRKSSLTGVCLAAGNPIGWKLGELTRAELAAVSPGTRYQREGRSLMSMHRKNCLASESSVDKTFFRWDQTPCRRHRM